MQCCNFSKLDIFCSKFGPCFLYSSKTWPQHFSEIPGSFKNSLLTYDQFRLAFVPFFKFWGVLNLHLVGKWSKTNKSSPNVCTSTNPFKPCRRDIMWSIWCGNLLDGWCQVVYAFFRKKNTNGWSFTRLHEMFNHKIAIGMLRVCGDLKPYRQLIVEPPRARLRQYLHHKNPITFTML